MERRKFTRFKAQDDAYAAIRGDYTKVGKIYDISINGLAFKYFSDEVSDEKINYVNIFLSNDVFFINDIPCTVVCIEDECAYNSNIIKSSRCGLKFEQLNETQLNELGYFLDKYTTGVQNS